jgi:hypothetical protein
VDLSNPKSLSKFEISMKTDMLDKNCELSIKPPSIMENFTAYIFRIDPVTLKTIPGEYKRRIGLNIEILEKLKFL